MKLHTLFIILLSALVFTLNGCGGGSSSTSTPINPTNPTVEVTITDDYQVESLGTENTINAKVSLGNTAKDLYLILSNNANTSASSTIVHNAKVVESGAQSKSISPTHFMKNPMILRAPQYVREFNKNLKTLLQKKRGIGYQAKSINTTKRAKDVANSSTSSFCVEINNNGDCTSYTTATARSVIDVSTEFGEKTLNIWVSDDSFGSGCSKKKCVTQNMVDQLTNSFLLAGEDNDIYDWVTNIYEEEWGSAAEAKYSELIPEDDEITILLTDIVGDNSPTGGVIGFFWSKDNLNKATVSGSNERIMFYADAVMFANGEDGWDIDDFWPKEMISTLAHEFQHMIHFYQKTILLLDANSEGTDVWINEMLSETTEDLIATKIRHIGPRGIEYTDGSDGPTGNTDGRYPLFNENNTLSLTAWDNQLADYSKVNAFGAYLIRNYGGAKLLHDIMHNAHIDEQAIMDAVNKSAEGSGKTFDNLLSEWGTAVLLSNIESPGNLPTYNTGWFTDTTYENSTYEMGSINFFNYDPLPTIYTRAGTVQAQGNYYYKVGADLTGDVTITLKLNGQTEATLIAK
ncbi:MAG: hypothetical protein U9R13_03145 [Campylobacterota bacterium]|nr:hypothetical protein [Campylobacterota bacterium]